MKHELHALKNPDRTYKRRLGRGTGSGSGTTAGRGTKGQNARSGGGVRPRFEGGHTPLYRLTPKLRGFTSRFNDAAEITIGALNRHFAAKDTVTRTALRKKKLIGSRSQRVKLLNGGELKKALTVHVDAASKSAIATVEKAGGSVIFPTPKKATPKKAPADKKATEKPAKAN